MNPPREKLFTAKELAGELRRSYGFVKWMRRRGFPMPGGTATLTEARQWLTTTPKPCARRLCPGVTICAPQ